MTDMKKRYGVDNLTFEQEMNLWKDNKALAITRQSKIRLVDTFERMKELAEHMAEYCKTIPEEDNENHANLCRNFADTIESLKREMDKKINDAIYGNS